VENHLALEFYYYFIYHKLLGRTVYLGQFGIQLLGNFSHFLEPVIIMFMPVGSIFIVLKM
jgi:hypothetical protein